MKLLTCYALFFRGIKFVLETSTRICFLGQRPENPLLLLGQYSDDDLDEESSKGVNHAVVDTSSADFDDQAKVAGDEECEDIEINESKDLAAQKVDQHDIEKVSSSLECFQKLGENGSRENNATDSSNLHSETGLTEQISVPETSDAQVNGEVGSGWKIVLHEESNQYYYWNTLTGETSWEVPDVLAQGTELTSEPKGAADAEGTENAVVGTHKSNSTLDVKLEDSVAAQHSDGSNAADPKRKTEEILEYRQTKEVLNEGYTSEVPYDKKRGHDVDQIDEKKSCCTVGALPHETSSPGKFVSSSQSDDALLGNGSGTCADSEKYIHSLRDHGEHETGSDLYSRLLRHGEYLLERLNTLKGSKGRLIGHDKISKYILEVEIRICDIKSLSPYGSSLLPFWLHSERQLKQLESAISDEVLQFYESVEMSELEATLKSQESISDDVKADAIEKKAVCSTSEDSHASHYASITEEVLKESRNEAYNNAAIHNDQFISEDLNSLSDSGPGGKGEAHEVAIPAELAPTFVVDSEEDVDMDVEMELEDAIPASHTLNNTQGSQYYAPPEQKPIWPNPPAEHDSFVSDDAVGAPPPPDDDWIPPPPPDNEPFPPPPPDEPPESSYPPPLPDSVIAPSFSYASQYNLTYPGSSLEYYGQTNPEVPESTFYAPDASQLTVPLPSYYYESVPNTYSAAPVVVNPVDPVSYYGLQDETVPPVPGVSGVESSGLHSAPGYESLSSDQNRSVEALTEVDSISIPTAGVDVSTVGEETQKNSVEVSFASVSDQAPATISVSSTPVVTVAIAARVPNVQSKVPRNKKRTAAVSTLRSNKKVSSLVDKWNAAKEELHEEEEDEPENAYDMLEKKRRREIEEWRAQQIASGEAKNNANFQPLGGNWRERVKRKKARLMSESVQASSEVTTDGNQQPDLAELSRDLPSGWQAYWDESSKQVYYGNSVTSETTWIRPTN